MTDVSEVSERRKKQQKKIRIMLNTVKAGEMLQLIVPYEGRPLPDINWRKQEPPKKGWEFLEPEVKDLRDYAKVTNSPYQTILTIRRTSKDDSGSYKLSIQVGDMIVEAPIQVAVIDVPSPVRNLKVDEVIGNSVEISKKCQWKSKF